MNTFCRLLLNVVILLAITSSAGVAEEPLRVMSFNIRYGTANDGDNHWDKRHELVVETIHKFAPDLLGTQETLGFQARYLQDNLPEYTYFGSSRDTNPAGEQCGVFYKTDRFELIESGQFWLSETPDVKFSKSWDSSLPRIATWVRLEDKLNDNSPLVFINTHFDHRGAVARLESAKLLRRFIEDLDNDSTVIVTGDFNCPEASQPYIKLLESPLLVDTYRAVHESKQKNEGTFNGFRGTTTGGRIDWILCSPTISINEASIVRTHDNNRYPSDHFPVTALLKYRKK